MGGINQQGYVTSSPSIFGCHKLSSTDSVAASDSTTSRHGPQSVERLFSPPPGTIYFPSNSLWRLEEFCEIPKHEHLVSDASRLSLNHESSRV